MGLPTYAAEAVEVGRWTTAGDIDRAVEPLTAACAAEQRRLR
jgi:hypothetical protein